MAPWLEVAEDTQWWNEDVQVQKKVSITEQEVAKMSKGGVSKGTDEDEDCESVGSHDRPEMVQSLTERWPVISARA